MRDASDLFQVRYPDAFRRLLKLLVFDVGNLLNMSNLAQDCGVNRKTVQNYLDILEETHIVRRILPFQDGKRSEVTRTPKCYFVDNGIRNILLGQTSEPDILERPDTGALVENWLLSELLKNLPSRWSVQYWRSTSKAKMDFVLSDGQQVIAVEVKADRLTRPAFSRSARSFLYAYAPSMLFVINQSLNTEIMMSDRPVRFVPLEAAIPAILEHGGIMPPSNF
ncbi:ATP-binding protein [Desulfonatronum parangueonense]